MLASSHVSTHAARRKQLSIYQPTLLPSTAFSFSVWSVLLGEALLAPGPSAMLHMQQSSSVKLHSRVVNQPLPVTSLKPWTCWTSQLIIATAIDMAYTRCSCAPHQQ